MLNVYKPKPVVLASEEPATIEINLDGLEDGLGNYNASSDQEIVIKVAENPTTGYRWEVDSKNCGVRVKQVKDDFILPADSLPGAGG